MTGRMRGGVRLAAAALALLAGCDAPPEPAAEFSEVATSQPWDAARARGAAFRAVGNEPGWSVEVGGGDPPALHAELDFGSRRVEVASAAATAEGWRGEAEDGSEVVLEIRREECRDVMSGQAFPASARLRVGDSTWRGCGRFLLE